MTLAEAIKVLAELYDPATGGLRYASGQWASWTPDVEDDCAGVDGSFSADELEAMAVVIRANKVTKDHTDPQETPAERYPTLPDEELP